MEASLSPNTRRAYSAALRRLTLGSTAAPLEDVTLAGGRGVLPGRPGRRAEPGPENGTARGPRRLPADGRRFVAAAKRGRSGRRTAAPSSAACQQRRRRASPRTSPSSAVASDAVIVGRRSGNSKGLGRAAARRGTRLVGRSGAQRTPRPWPSALGSRDGEGSWVG